MSSTGTTLRRSRAPRSAGAARWVALGVLGVAVAAVVAFAAVVSTSSASLSVGAESMATISLPTGGGTIVRVAVLRESDQRPVPVRVSHGQIVPTKLIRPGERLTVYATVRRPGWISWLTGKTQQLHLSLTTPKAVLVSDYVTRHGAQPLRIAFRSPVRVVQTGASPVHMNRRVLPASATSFTVPVTGTAGTFAVAAAPRTWERPKGVYVSWFPSGKAATAIARPAPGTSITPQTKITLTFSKPVDQALGTSLPPVSPAAAGAWHRLNSRTIQFVPTGYGYGLGAQVTVALPSGIHLVAGTQVGSDPQGHWSVPAGSTARLQQLLAGLGYLPVDFTQSGTPVATTLEAQMEAAVNAPAGTFGWRYPNTPSDLEQEWAPGTSGELTKGAIMAFENDQGMTADGVAGPAVWKALIAATLAGKKSAFGYSYVNVSEGSPESESVWHNGKTVVSGAVNTGVAAAPTAQGVFAVFEHLQVTTMSGTNPDGSTYVDPGIPWVSYFNGGDALHGFIRASYGFPQSDGCVEMPYSEAEAVWPYTPIGTIVNVHA